ncbi:hypothetical protein CEXT_186211 [Caerostris extrusa]|uniref:Uncharacterized protein n=1 Tax=Caerostris extrusa TaxID=172846 RepID=A0AAV4TXL6_CAEEX|nr:hypothetical protein CEXT_186211 [Caerostris extrusa]
MATEDKRHPLTPSGGQKRTSNSETPLQVDLEFYIFDQMANWETATFPGPLLEDFSSHFLPFISFFFYVLGARHSLIWTEWGI